jgi:uncharacterized membrane protein
VDGSPTVPAPRPDRLESVDLVRGLVMIVMALDHVRDFFSNLLYHDVTNLDSEKTTTALFLTRWVTHYCAPTFIFLAGTSAYLAGTRGKSKPELAWFLFTRGLWLAFFEITINRFFWWFNYDTHDIGAGVFWAIGWSMVVLSWLVFLPTKVVTVLGIAMIVSHNLLDGLPADRVGLPPWLWGTLHSTEGGTVVGTYKFGTGYCLIPWCGVMAAGYGFGSLLQLPPRNRQYQLVHLGASLILAFIVIRSVNRYGDAKPWVTYFDGDTIDGVRTFLSFLNCTKYPPSLLYLLMTLGPAILAVGLFSRPLGAWAKPILVFGRVPMFFYVLHIPLIHGGAVLLDHLRFGWSPLTTGGPWDVTPGVLDRHPDYGVSLGWVYVIWVAVVFILYWPCLWYAGVKKRSKSVWLSYL